MANEMLTFTHRSISVKMNNGLCFSQQKENLCKFYCLLLGSDIQANDSTCYVFVFKEEMWVVPELTNGAIDLKKWLSPLRGEMEMTVAQLDHLPFSWRARRFLGGLTAKLSIKNSDDFKDIDNKLSHLVNTSIFDVL